MPRWIVLLTEWMRPIEDLAEDLAAGVRNADVFAVFQPQIDLSDGSTVAVEALCRWRHPLRGLVPPDAFIRLAEDTGIIHELGLFMLAESLAAADEWRDQGRDLDVSVNVSPVQLTSTEFTTRLAEELSLRSMPAKGLTIEITESLPVLDQESLLPRLQELRDLGLGISLDDYGTGHASVAQFESLPLTEVKLDGSLIRGEGERSPESLSEIVDRAHDRGLCVVAEGIETLAHLETAVGLGCDRAQGYLIGPPRVRGDVERIVHR